MLGTRPFEKLPVTLSWTSDWILVVAGTLLVSQLEDGPQPHAARARRVSVLRPAPSSRRYRWPKPLAQTVSDLGMKLRGDLPKPSARLLDWCANPPGDRRECGRGAEPLG